MTQKNGTGMIRQPRFSLGEVDVSTFTRTDVPEYLTAAQSLKNCEVGTTGLVRKRKGTSLKADMYGQGILLSSKLFEMVDNQDNHYIIVGASGSFFVYQIGGESNVIVTDRGTTVITDRDTILGSGIAGATFLASYPWPYQTADLDQLDYTQDNDSLILTHYKYPPGRVYISQYNVIVPPATTAAPPIFAYQPLQISPYPAYDFGKINYNGYGVTLTQDGEGGFTLSLYVGATDPGFIPATGVSPWVGGQILGAGATSQNPIGNGVIKTVAKNQLGTSIVFTGSVITPFEGNQTFFSGASYSIRQPAWGDAVGYPSKVVYYQNRLWLANTTNLKTTIFGSKINAPINFDVGSGLDSDAIIYTIGKADAGAIQWMNGGKQLEIYTSNYEFACPQSDFQALTPSTFSIRQQSSLGTSSDLKPLSYINDSYYVNRAGNAIINFHFTGVGLSYQAANVSVASSHLVKNPQNRALLRGNSTSQDNFIYFLNVDNSITAFQFASEYKLAALTPIVFETGVLVVDICTVENTVYMLKYYTLTKRFTLEAFDETTFMDSTIELTMDATGVLNGLDIYNGLTVNVVYAGQDFGQYPVVGGQITVFNPNKVSGTVFVGLIYDVEIKPMYIFAGASDSSMKKTITRIYVDYINSLDFSVNGRLVPYLNYADIAKNPVITPQTGQAIIESVQGWDRYGTITLTQSAPFDLQITSIGYQVAATTI